MNTSNVKWFLLLWIICGGILTGSTAAGQNEGESTPLAVQRWLKMEETLDEVREQQDRLQFQLRRIRSQAGLVEWTLTHCPGFSRGTTFAQKLTADSMTLLDEWPDICGLPPLTPPRLFLRSAPCYLYFQTAMTLKKMADWQLLCTQKIFSHIVKKKNLLIRHCSGSVLSDLQKTRLLQSLNALVMAAEEKNGAIALIAEELEDLISRYTSCKKIGTRIKT